MSSGTSVGAFQLALELEKKQALEPPGNVPGAENPQIASGTIRAMKGNTGIVYVGGADVDATHGFELAAGDAVSLDTLGFANARVFGTKAGDKVCVFWAGP